jgi:hypothetical protein
VPEICSGRESRTLPATILELFSNCKGNLVRVHEELAAGGAELSYPALTAFCRRHGIGQAPVGAAGQYHFEPGEEMQHDTSPHEVELAERSARCRPHRRCCATRGCCSFSATRRFSVSTARCFSPMRCATSGGAPTRVMIDNTHVVVLRGTGREMVPVPEMAAFGERFGFQFVAHAIGNANRSARVERPFWFIENNFLAGRTFSSWEDLNQQARQWCDKVNSTYKKHIRAVPRELFAVERLQLKPLPAWIPEVYRLHQRMVDVSKAMSRSTPTATRSRWTGSAAAWRCARPRTRSRFNSMPATWSRTAGSPRPSISGSMLAQHRPPRGQGMARTDPHPEEKAILEAAPEMADYVAAVKQRSRKVPGRCPAPTAAPGAGVSAGTAAGRRAGGRPLWSLRSGPAGTDDPAPRGARLLFARRREPHDD